MANTGGNGDGSPHGAENPPPPPPPSMAEVVAQQTQILQLLAQNIANLQPPQSPRGRHGQQQMASYSDFAGTHPPVFSKAEDRLEANSWLRLMEAKFELIACAEDSETVCAAHQLRGPAGS